MFSARSAMRVTRHYFTAPVGRYRTAEATRSIIAFAFSALATSAIAADMPVKAPPSPRGIDSGGTRAHPIESPEQATLDSARDVTPED
jgi:hypothetical protein